MDPVLGYHGFHFFGVLFALFIGFIIGRATMRRRMFHHGAAYTCCGRGPGSGARPGDPVEPAAKS